MSWKCNKCGNCCKFVVIPVEAFLDTQTEEYLAAHGVAYDGGKLIIPARCQYLTDANKCAIQSAKFDCCRLGGEKECKKAKEAYKCLEELGN